MASKRKIILFWVGFTMIGAMMLAGAFPALAQQGPEILVTSGDAGADEPDVAIDASGNTHIVYSEYDASAEYREIWYTMLDSSGNTLIQDTMITPDDGYDSSRPQIVIDSTNKVHILWRDNRWDAGVSHEVTYTKLDPFLDDRNGNAADPAAITLAEDTRLTNLGHESVFLRIAIDLNDDIHIVFEDYLDDANDDIDYMKIDNNGVVVIDVTTIRESVSQWRPNPDVALDSNNNAHITWAEYGYTDSDEVYYMMINGSNGAIMIDATLITTDDGYSSKWTSVAVDFEDKVHIVFQDERGSDPEIYYTSGSEPEVYYIKLDPDLDDQNGNAANGESITLIDDWQLTDDDDVKSRHPAIAAGCGGQLIHITWEETDGPDVYYIVMDTDGDTVVTETALTTDGTANPISTWTMPNLYVEDGGAAHVVWSDDRNEFNEIYYTTYLFSDADSDGVSDLCDDCPDDPDKIEPGTCGCGVPDTDTDSDGTPDCNDDDDDNDGMPDSWEEQYGLDPLVDDSLEDPDEDGVTNIDEYTNGWNPTQPQVNQPVLLWPVDGDVDVSLTPELMTDAFSDPDQGDTHLETQWQISTVSDFAEEVDMVLDVTSEVKLTSLIVPDLILDPETTYYWRVKFFDDQGAASVWSETFSFTTISAAESGDANQNGIPDELEVDEYIDLDGDGVDDREQLDFTPIKSIIAGKFIGLKLPLGLVMRAFKSVSIDDFVQTGLPPGTLFPFGVLSFKIEDVDVGGTIDLEIFFSEGFPPIPLWFKYIDNEETWEDFQDHVQFVEEGGIFKVILTLEDGGFGDLDGVANGIIVDPSGLAEGDVESGSSDGWLPSCFIDAAEFGF
jgi:hypothetical protein